VFYRGGKYFLRRAGSWGIFHPKFWKGGITGLFLGGPKLGAPEKIYGGAGFYNTGGGVYYRREKNFSLSGGKFGRGNFFRHKSGDNNIIGGRAIKCGGSAAY